MRSFGKNPGSPSPFGPRGLAPLIVPHRRGGLSAPQSSDAGDSPGLAPPGGGGGGAAFTQEPAAAPLAVKPARGGVKSIFGAAKNGATSSAAAAAGGDGDGDGGQEAGNPVAEEPAAARQRRGWALGLGTRSARLAWLQVRSLMARCVL